MREIKSEDINPLEALKYNLWQAMNLLRGFVDGNEFHFVLFLLTLQRKGLLANIIHNDQDKLKKQIELAISKLDADSAEDLGVILYVYDHILNRINTNVVYELISFFRSLDQDVLEEHFAEIFDDVLYKLSKWQGRVGGESMLPIEISRFVCGLTELPSKAKIYNPFAGVASFAVYLDPIHQYVGQEIDHKTWAIGKMRIMAHDLETSSRLLRGDSINDWNPLRVYKSDKPEDILVHGSVKEKYDLIISNPPFGMRVPLEISGKYGLIKSCEHFLIEKGLEELKPDGKLIAVISHGFLFRGGSERDIRQHIIENDLLEMVISLPAGLLTNTGIPVSVLVINRLKKNKGNVRFIDAANFIESKSAKEKILKDHDLSSFIKTAQEADFIKIVSNEGIQKLDFDLHPPRYFSKIFEGVELRGVLTTIRGQRVTGSTSGIIIRVKDLRSDKFDYKLSITPTDNSETLSGEQEISESSLLIASAGEKLKPTYFNYNGTSIYVNSNILVFRVNEEIIDLDYLISELYTDQVVEQTNSLSIGSGIRKIRRDDFLSIRIQVPDLLEQKAKVKGLKQEHIKSKERELSLQREILGLKDETFRDFASINHTLRQYLNALKSNVSGTRKFIAKNEDKNINLKTMYSKNLNQNLGEHLLSLENIIDSMSKLLLVKDEHRSDESRKVIELEMDLRALIKNAQKRFKNPEVFQFEELFIDQESLAFPDGDGGYILTYINILGEDFYRIFSNIISNAIDHGFKNRKNNIIRTSLSFNSETNKLVVEISNNGNPIEKGFTLKHLTTRGEKTTDSLGSGIGGADIKTLLDKYDALLDIKNEEKADFPVTYILQFELAVPDF